MREIIFSVILLITLLPISINASDCSGIDKERLQKLADNISVTLDEQNNNTFNATFSGLSNEIKIYNPSDYLNYYNTLPTTIGEATVENLKYGKTYQFRVSGYTKCYSNNIKTIIVIIPNKNPYYDDKICNDAKEYSLCQKWVSVDVPYDEFIKKVNNYIQDNNKINKRDDNVDSNDKKNNFFEFYEKYYWPTFVGMICILGLLIFLWIKENKKNKL